MTKRCDKNDAPTLNFSELPIEVTHQLSQEYVPDQRLSGVYSKKDKRSFAMMKVWFALCLKKLVRGSDTEEWLKYPIYLQ